EEFKQPEKPKFLEKDKYYVIYRSCRTFASAVITPQDLQVSSENGKYEIVTSDATSYITTNDETKAYYYSVILNYLAYKVIEERGAFERRQNIRPLIAILHANLKWKKDKWQLKVAKLGKQLHQKSPKCLMRFIRKGMQVEKCFEMLRTCNETEELFEDIIKIVYEYIYEYNFNKLLRFVCKLKSQ
ncbi:MAG: hypothetical protein DRN12_05965, partial [Thermoplasmata archaeon]